MSESRRPTRWLAPLAIVAVAVTGYGIARNATRGGNASGDGRPAATKTRVTTSETTREPASPEPTKRTYTVRGGDTLSAISLETGVSVGRLEELNPDLDVQALQPGQRLKLRR